MPGIHYLYYALAVGVVATVVLAAIGKVPIQYNARNLVVRWRTTFMTALAFTLVVSLLVVMLAFVNGMYRLTEQSGHPGNVIILSDGATDEQFSNLGFGDSSEIMIHPMIERDASGRPQCSREIYLVVNQPIPPREGKGPRRRFIQLRGIEDSGIAASVHGVGIRSGKWFSDAGVQEVSEPGKSPATLIEGVLGEGVAREMGADVGKSALEPGDRFELGGRNWIVAGVMNSAGSTFGSEVWAKAGLIGPIFGKNTYTSLVARTKGPREAAEFAELLSNQFKKAAVAGKVETEYFKSLQQTNLQFLVAIIFVTVVTALGGIFGVMNTMFAAISQRIKDIGVLRILGFSRGQILVSFLLESLLLAIIGGAVGCAIGSLSNGWTATSMVGSGQGGGKSVVLQLVVTSGTLAAGLFLAIAMGAIGGLVPAISAVRVRPLESLR